MSDITPNSPAPSAAVQLELAPPPIQAIDTPKTPAQLRFETRMWCSFIFAMCTAMLGIALYMRPDPLHLGSGTHQQLGLPPCGWLQTTGYPCPTCGCTTAVTWFVHAHPVKSFLTQPFGFVVALLAALLTPLSLWGLVRGKWLGPAPFVLAWYWRYWTYGPVLLLLAAWVYKIIITKMNVIF